ncbi:hypothetical protein PQ744_10690 [Thermoanaerobacterium thermosaccharolyticum]|uniref:hypothetical protein n=1 Tax=Thermoanaerobacterium thermosaccharolyticum TaxID=1517 RepID=UPI003D27C034
MTDKKYYVLKESGTYSNALEAYGLAELILGLTHEKAKISIIDKGIYYELDVKDMELSEIRYFDLFPYLKKKDDKEVIEKGIKNYIDLEEEKERKNRYNDYLKKINEEKKKAKSLPDAKSILAELDKKIKNYEDKPIKELDVITGINQFKALDMYKKAYFNLYDNKDSFQNIIDVVLRLYSDTTNNIEEAKAIISDLKKKRKIKNIEKVNSLQLYNPSMVKGAHPQKSNDITPKSVDEFWLQECLKIAGSFTSMVIKPVQIAKQKWDNKVYVFDVNNLDWDISKKIFNEFKKLLKGNTSIRLDINSVLLMAKELIQHREEYKSNRKFLNGYRPHDEIKGFYTVYFKNMGNANSPTNISFIELPLFIEINSDKEVKDWIEIIDEHLKIINNIRNSISDQDESGNIISLLKTYRQFLTTSDMDYFYNFIGQYSIFLMEQIAKKNYFTKPFSEKLMEVFLLKTDSKISEILQNQGFRNIAKAIRKSTISEQYAKSKGQQKYDIRYGLAQELLRKSAYKEDLIEFLSEFIVSYNQETAKMAEKDKGKVRATIKQQDLEDLVKLIDEYDNPSLIGKLLCAFGYSLDRKEKEDELAEDENNELDEING